MVASGKRRSRKAISGARPASPHPLSAEPGYSSPTPGAPSVPSSGSPRPIYEAASWIFLPIARVLGESTTTEAKIGTCDSLKRFLPPSVSSTVVANDHRRKTEGGIFMGKYPERIREVPQGGHRHRPHRRGHHPGELLRRQRFGGRRPGWEEGGCAPAIQRQ